MSGSFAAESALAPIVAAQHGVFTREQARSAGFSAPQIERRVRAEVWVRVLPRVYRYSATPSSSLLEHWAAVLWAGPDCALSHSSAAAVWRIRAGPVDRPQLIVSRTRAPRVVGVVVHRVARFDDGDLRLVRGLPVTSPVRTIIDLASVLGATELELALADARARDLVTVRALRVRLSELGSAGRPGAGLLRAICAPIGSGRVERSARMAG